MKVNAKEQVSATYSLDTTIKVDYTDKEVGSSMLKHVDVDLEKGTVLVVGNLRGSKVKLDAVNLAIARAITAKDENDLGRFQFIDRAKIEKGQTVYLAAHGIFRTRTIDGRSLEEIAKLLVKAGYDGSQRIISFACDLDKTGIDPRAKVLGEKDPHKTMREQLVEELMAELFRVGKSCGKSNIHISNYANGKTIVLNRSKIEGASEGVTNADLWVTNPTLDTGNALLAQKVLMYYGHYYFTPTYADLAPGTEVEVSSLGKRVKHVLDSMDRFKFSLVQGFLKNEKGTWWGGAYDPNTQFNLLEMVALGIGGLTSLFGLASGALNTIGTAHTIGLIVVIAVILLELIRDAASTRFGKDGFFSYFRYDTLILIALLAGSGVAATLATEVVPQTAFIATVPYIVLIYTIFRVARTLNTMFS